MQTLSYFRSLNEKTVNRAWARESAARGQAVDLLRRQLRRGGDQHSLVLRGGESQPDLLLHRHALAKRHATHAQRDPLPVQRVDLRGRGVQRVRVAVGGDAHLLSAAAEVQADEQRVLLTVKGTGCWEG